MRCNLAWLGPLLICPALAGCLSLWEQQSYQEVAWSDGSDATLEVWLTQGSMMLGQPWLFVLDTLATPVIWIAETNFALVAAGRDDIAISYGPLGFVASLLPGITCMPLDVRPSGLRLHEPLPVPAAAREELLGLSDARSVEWLAHWCGQAWGADHPKLADNVRYWVTAVRVGPPRPDSNH